MSKALWREHTLAVSDLNLAWYDRGNGPTVLLLHGGPGDEHSYLRPVAEPLCEQFRCVLYDQRGTGGSVLGILDETTLDVGRFVDDLEALRVELGIERLNLVGHSWGADLGLLYGATHPQRVDRLVLAGLGPLTDEMSAVAAANLMHPLSRDEREEWANLALQRRVALQQGDEEAIREIDAALMPMRVRAWFYSPEKAMQFLKTYLSGPFPNRIINRHVNNSYREVSILDKLDRLKAPVLIMYGYQDFEPITQAYLLQQRMPQARICLLNECGHLPWLEQPEAFYQELTRFLA